MTLSALGWAQPPYSGKLAINKQQTITNYRQQLNSVVHDAFIYYYCAKARSIHCVSHVLQTPNVTKNQLLRMRKNIFDSAKL